MAISTYKIFLMKKASTGDTYEKVIDIKDFPDLGGAPEMLETTPMIDQVRKIVNRFLWQGQCREWDAIDKEKRLKTTSMVSRHLV